MKPTSYYISIFFLSASIIAYEIALTRIFSITLWYHFAYLIISIALLGFGASGTFIAIFHSSLLKRFAAAYTVLSFSFSTSILFCFLLSQRIKFDPFLIVWDKRQLLYLMECYLIFFIPFFFAATCIGLSFLQFREQTNKIYFFNLAGSGCGALLIILLLYKVHPSRAVLWTAALPLASGLLFALALERFKLSVLNLLRFGLATYFIWVQVPLNISQYKGLKVSQNLPEAKIEAERVGPLGVVQVLSSPAIRYAPGLSLNFTGELPRQHALFVDADSAAAITRFTGDLHRLDYLDWMSSALPYQILERPKVLIIGAGGGSEALLALYHKAQKVQGLEIDADVVDLIKDKFGEFAGHIYSHPDVHIALKEGRGFIESTRENYDLIQVSLIDSFSSSTAGVYASTESYLYTIEAMESYMQHLTQDGVLSITRWIKTPPRDNIKMFATVVEALERSGYRDLPRHLIFIRSWATATLLVKKSPFGSEEIKRAKDFCESRSFDLIFYDGIKPEEVNVYNVLPRPLYYEAALKILSNERSRFYKDHLFNIEPATDDRPYFFHFFKWKELPSLLQSMGRDWIPFVEWGYVVLIASLIQAVPISAILILMPLLFLKRRVEGKAQFGRPEHREVVDGRRVSRSKTFVYFFSLGLGFLFIEMAFIQKFSLFLAHPIYSIAVVLSAFLMFSGLGSLSSNRIRFGDRDAITVATVCIAALLILHMVTIGSIFKLSMGLSDLTKILISGLLIAPLAFFMGIPFPSGLERISKARPELMAWAWGINGCASVLSTMLATLLAMTFGFSRVVLVAAALYLIAGVCRPADYYLD